MTMILKKRIVGFYGKYRFLSNFYPSSILRDGILYSTVEHAYQAEKVANPADKERVRKSPSPGLAKQLGRRLRSRTDWNEIKVECMRELVRLKFEQNLHLLQELLSTGDAELIEANYWHDAFWGTYQGKGKNTLGKILMEVRAELAATSKV